MAETATNTTRPNDLADRSPLEEIRAQQRRLAQADFATKLLKALSGPVAVLNENRQVLAANGSFHKVLRECEGQEDPTGGRPGEIFRCVHADAEPGGCGTSAACGSCGALQAILAAVAGEGCRRDCVIHRAPDIGDLRLTVRTRPLEIRGERFLILTVD